MDYEKLAGLTVPELKGIAESLGVKSNGTKKVILGEIEVCFREYEAYKTEKVDKYKKIERLGEPGKEGIAYLVVDKNMNEYAMKTFRVQKSSERLEQEAALQAKAAEAGVSPRVIETDTVSKYIVMEKMDRHLVDVMKKQNGDLKKSQQKAIIKLFKKLDDAGVFHGDANILNYMYRGKDLYMIDFGMSKEITSKLQKKLGTYTPNYTLMLAGLIIKLKELKCPSSAYEHLLTHVPEADRKKYNF